MCKVSECKTVYSEIDYSVPEYGSRYEAYALLHPEMSADEVVWRVNNHLDKEKYEFDVPVSDGNDPYVIVNKFFKLPVSFCPDSLTEADGCPMRPETAKAYLNMKKAAADAGLSIHVVSAYRSIQEQQALYDKHLETETVEIADQTCARACYSEHHTGMAIDLEGSVPGARNISKTKEASWLKENCHQYGFILRYLPETVEITGYISEPWHFRYVGTAVSIDMKEKQILSFEEYKERYLKKN